MPGDRSLAGRRLRRVACLVVACATAVGAGVVRADVPAWVRLADLAARYGLGEPAAESGGRVVVRDPYRQLVFEPGARRVWADGDALYLNSEVVRRGTAWWMSAYDAATIIAPLLDPADALAGLGARVVILDPGHGGGDPGTRTRDGIEEKALTLDMALRVAARLRACQIEVHLTRDRDRDLTLDQRCEVARRVHGDLFVSIHFNSAKDRATNGIETFIVPAAGALSTCESRVAPARRRRAFAIGNQFDAANTVLGYWVHRGLLSRAHVEDRGLRRASYFVVRNTSCPATLVEAGFLTHAAEATRLQDETYRQTLADGLASGILTYLSRVREANGSG